MRTFFIPGSWTQAELDLVEFAGVYPIRAKRLVLGGIEASL
jgi:hypothetical protein